MDDVFIAVIIYLRNIANSCQFIYRLFSDDIAACAVSVPFTSDLGMQLCLCANE